jgi:hypothetical protein
MAALEAEQPTNPTRGSPPAGPILTLRAWKQASARAPGRAPGSPGMVSEILPRSTRPCRRSPASVRSQDREQARRVSRGGYRSAW